MEARKAQSLRNGVLRYAKERYKTEPDYPWSRFPDYCVLRHSDNRKWYGLIMNIPAQKLGMAEGRRVDILNIKLDPILIGSLRLREGFFPSYHMRSDNWITILLDATVELSEIEPLLDMSYDITMSKKKVKRPKAD